MREKSLGLTVMGLHVNLQILKLSLSLEGFWTNAQWWWEMHLIWLNSTFRVKAGRRDYYLAREGDSECSVQFQTLSFKTKNAQGYNWKKSENYDHIILIIIRHQYSFQSDRTKNQFAVNGKTTRFWSQGTQKANLWKAKTK